MVGSCIWREREKGDVCCDKSGGEEERLAEPNQA